MKKNIILNECVEFDVDVNLQAFMKEVSVMKKLNCTVLRFLILFNAEQTKILTHFSVRVNIVYSFMNQMKFVSNQLNKNENLKKQCQSNNTEEKLFKNLKNDQQIISDKSHSILMLTQTVLCINNALNDIMKLNNSACDRYHKMIKIFSVYSVKDFDYDNTCCILSIDSENSKYL